MVSGKTQDEFADHSAACQINLHAKSLKNRVMRVSVRGYD